MSDPPPPVQLTRMITGIVASRAIFVAAQLGLADLVADGPQSSGDMAAATKTHAPSLHRLLRALAGLGIFAEDSDGCFGLTPMAELLQSDHPSHMRAVALMTGDEQSRALQDLGYSVRTGESAFDHVFGQPVFEFLGDHPEKARIFDAAMTGIHGPETRPMIEAYDFSTFDTIVDIGGGNASVLLEILRACPGVNGIIFDLPNVAAHAADLIAASDLASRARAEGGSFFDAVTTGADCYLMRHIIHDWDDEKSITILRHCREAMRPDGRILVVDSVIPPGNEPHPGKIIDLIMLAVPGGLERTAEQFESLFAAAGLKMSRIVPTASPVSVVEGVAA